MCELANQFESAILDEGQEFCTGGFEKSTNSIGRNLLLDTDHAVDFEDLVTIDVFESVDPNCGCWGASRGKGFRGTAFRAYLVPSR